MQKDFRDILKSNRIIFCWNVIDFAFSERTISRLLEFVRTPDEQNIATLLINSSGGSLADTFALADLMNSLEVKIRTVGIGQVSSAAMLILLSGSKNERYAFEHTEFLVHSIKWDTQEHVKYPELVNRRAREDELNRQMIEFYLKRSKLDKKKIEVLFSGFENFISAEIALEYGFIDKIIS